MRGPEPATATSEVLRPGGRALRLLRRCLGCMAMFDSEWAGERICRDCKRKARWRVGTGASSDER